MKMHHPEQDHDGQSPVEAQSDVIATSISKNGKVPAGEAKVEPEKKRQRISEEAGTSAQKLA